MIGTSGLGQMQSSHWLGVTNPSQGCHSSHHAQRPRPTPPILHLVFTVGNCEFNLSIHQQNVARHISNHIGGIAPCRALGQRHHLETDHVRPWSRYRPGRPSSPAQARSPGSGPYLPEPLRPPWSAMKYGDWHKTKEIINKGHDWVRIATHC
jgi:hypothetical protein